MVQGLLRTKCRLGEYHCPNMGPIGVCQLAKVEISAPLFPQTSHFAPGEECSVNEFLTCTPALVLTPLMKKHFNSEHFETMLCMENAASPTRSEGITIIWFTVSAEKD